MLPSAGSEGDDGPRRKIYVLKSAVESIAEAEVFQACEQFRDFGGFSTVGY